MPAVSLTIEDLTDFAEIPAGKAQKMIDSALARAARVAPCIRDESLSSDNAEAARSIIRDAILRWQEAGAGTTQTEVAGPFSKTTQYQARRGLFWPSEIEELEEICRSHNGEAASSGAYAIDTVGVGDVHAEWCAINFGAGYCDCGAVIAGFPIFGQPEA